MATFMHNGVTAHRGDPVHYPENTLPGFVAGAVCGADWVETDVHLTKDGVAVLCHDATTGRTADANLVIAESTLKELRELDFSHSFRVAHNLDVTICPRTVIPTLEEALQMILWTKKARFSIQLKADGIEEEVARVVRRTGAVEWTGFNEGTLQRLINIRKFLPNTYIFYDVSKKDVPVEDYIDVCCTNGFQELVMHYQYVTIEKCAKIRAAGIMPGAWNIGDAEKMWLLLGMGVFRIYADAPLVMLQVLKESENIDILTSGDE